jgi:hypothetical protein
VAHARGCHTVRSHMDRRPSINKQQAHVSKMRLVLMRACESSSSPAIAILLPLSYSTTFPLVLPPTTKTTSQPTAPPSTTNRTSRPNSNIAAVLPPPFEAPEVPPPFYNVPEFNYEPKHGSYGKR